MTDEDPFASEPYTDLFAGESFDVVDAEAAMPNKARGDNPDLPERVRAFVDEVAAEDGREASEYEVWHNDTQILVFVPDEFPKPLPNTAIDLNVVADTVHRKLDMIGTAPTYDVAEDVPVRMMSTLRKIIAEQAPRDIPPVMSEPMYDMYMPITGVIQDPTVLKGGWCAPSEAERWQWLTDDERAAEVAEARAAADRHGHDYIVVGGMTMPHPPASLGGFLPLPMPTDGMWELPAVRIPVDTEEFQASMAEARERIGDLAAGLAAAFDTVNAGLGPALAALGQALDDRDGILPIVDAPTALAALDYAERTRIVGHPDKRTRRRAKTHYLAARRYLPAEHRRRLKSVPINQFGALT